MRNRKYHKRPEAKISKAMFTAPGVPHIRAKTDNKMTSDVWGKYRRLSVLSLPEFALPFKCENLGRYKRHQNCQVRAIIPLIKSYISVGDYQTMLLHGKQKGLH